MSSNNSFFNTKEFKFMKKLRERIQILNTENNYNLYKKYLKICKDLARTKFGNIGWREELGRYAWDNEIKEEESPIMECLGDSSEMCFCPGYILYMDRNFETMVLKDKNEVLYKYTKEETNAIRNCSVAQLQKIQWAKKEFEGTIVK